MPIDLGGVFDRQSGEVAQLNQLGGLGILGGQAGQGFVDVEKLVRRRGEADVGGVEGHTTTPAAAFVGLLAAGLIDENAAHRLGRGGEEVTAAVPGRLVPLADQAQVGLVNEGGGLERLPRLFLRQLLRGQLAQLVVDERQQPAGGLRVVVFDGVQQLRDIFHDAQGNRLDPSLQTTFERVEV